MDLKLSDLTLSKLFQNSKTKHLEFDNGYILQLLLNDVDSIKNLYCDIFIYALSSIFQIICYIIFFSFVNYYMIIILLSLSFVVLFIFVKTHKKIEHLEKNISFILNDLTFFATESLNGIKSICTPGCTIQITGGEPLLKKELLYKTIELVNELKFDYLTINTNGYFLTDNDIKEFSKYKIDNFTISLDGGEKIHNSIRGENSFNKALNSILKLKNAGFNVTASMTIHNKNFDLLEDFIIFCNKYHIHSFTSPMFPLGRGKNLKDLKAVPIKEIYYKIKNIYKKGLIDVDQLEGTYFETILLPVKDLVKRYYCGTGLSTLFLDSNGDIYPCANTMCSRFLLGNIKMDNVIDIWNSKTLNEIRKINVNNFENCRDCDLKYICTGYCRGLTYQVTNNLNSEFIWCDEIHEILIDAIWTLSEDDRLFNELNAKYEVRHYSSVSDKYNDFFEVRKSESYK